MGWWRWWRNRTKGTDAALRRWRSAWQEAALASGPDEPLVSELAGRLDALGLPREEVEVEHEMLEALRQLATLLGSVEANGLPVLETGHRVVGRDRCHFSAPVSMPDDPAQPSGRLLLTSARAVFVGGPNAATVAWHAIGRVFQTERDLILIRRDTETMYRFRCNSYGDALCAGYLARRLSGPRTGT